MDLSTLHSHFLESSGICTDTRKITQDAIFFALKGANFNGNQFASTAVKEGAKLAVVDEATYNNIPNTILVEDCLQTLQALATFHRKFLNIPIIALTGSNGKTTTKELIYSVLAQKYYCKATLGNLNNHIGVPLTLLSFTKNHEIGIVEMGANHQGEIQELAKIALPNYGYITNFGKAHLEGFGGVEGVIKGKSELYKHIALHEGKLFVNGEDAKQMELTKSIDRIIFNNADTGTYDIQLIEETGFLKISYQDQIIETQIIGDYNFSNISAAITIGTYFDVSTSAIKKGLEDYIPAMNRSQIVKKESNQILLDAYNANPTSMLAALQNFDNIETESKMVILGDMFELGDAATTEHQEIVNYLLKKITWKVVLVGENFYQTNTQNSHITKYESFDSFKMDSQLDQLRSHHILIKGSRGMALERCLDLF